MSRPGDIAIVGADGAGKSTVIREILRTHPELRYLYGGAAIEPANFSLPTSRWLVRRWRRELGPMLEPDSSLPPRAVLPKELKRRLRRNRWQKVLGLVNRIAEEWYRWFVAALYRLRGMQVLWDRHFLFDYCPDSPAVRPAGRGERFHHWLLARLYPLPALVIFLDAPPDVLFARKGEWNVAYLQQQRENILDQGSRLARFVVVNANRPLEAVVAEVAHLVADDGTAGLSGQETWR